jgi:hypothetical protein
MVLVKVQEMEEVMLEENMLEGMLREEEEVCLMRQTSSLIFILGETSAVKEDSGEGVASRPVSVANQSQCCGKLKSGVCNLI